MSSRADDLIERLQAEIVKRDARIAEHALEIERITRAYTSDLDELAQRNYNMRFEIAALKAQPSGMVLPERIVIAGHLTAEQSYRASGYNACLDEASRLNPCRSQAVPDGYVLVPERMHLDANVIEAINFHCGDGQEDAGYGQHTDGLLWVGFTEDDDGVKSYGLNIATAEYPEEGSTQLVEFAAAPSAQQKESE